MRRSGFYLVAIAMSVCVVVVICSASAQSAGSVFVTTMPAGYRDWKLISVAHEEANLRIFERDLQPRWRSRDPQQCLRQCHSRFPREGPLQE
jgi:hypothetical protein